MPTASWNQLEHAIEQLHAAAREPMGEGEFYRKLIAEATAALDAGGGAAWRRGAGGRPELVCQTLPDDRPEGKGSARLELVAHGLAGGGSRTDSLDSEHDLLVCPVADLSVTSSVAEGRAAKAIAAIELWLPAGASPAVRRGWLDFAAALADIAADFHVREELRRLRGASALRGHALDLVRRVGGPRTTEEAAFEAANEGRRLLECDRVTILVRRGRRWRLAAASGVDAVDRRTEFARTSERLAEQTARWGEPIEHPGIPVADNGAELPPRVAAAIEQHIDRSHARALACVPIKYAPQRADDQPATPATFDMVLIAERFSGGGALREALVELGELCAPALARAAELDRFGVRTALRWSDCIASLRQPARLGRVVLTAGVIAAAAAALVFVPWDFAVEAPARMATVVERDVFATASGAVAEVRVSHGQMVARGDVLVVLRDPELALKLQEISGQLDAARNAWRPWP